MRRSVAVVIAALLLAGGAAFATGFMMFEHGAAATAMADSRTAISDDVSSLFYNPAAITELPGLQLQLGVTGVLPYVDYEPAGRPDEPREYMSIGGQMVEVNDGENPQSAKVKGFTPIHVYASYRIEDAHIAVGYALNNPFGLGTYWPGDWDGRFITTESDLETFFHQPTVAIDVAGLLGFEDSLKLSVAAGYHFVHANARLSRKIDLRLLEPLFGVEGPEGEMRMRGSAVGHGWVAALYAELPGMVSFGATFRGGFEEKGRMGLPFSGTAKFRFNEAGQVIADTLPLHIPPETGGRITIDIPFNMNFGVALLAVENLKVALDFYVAFFQSYDELLMEFECLQDPESPDYCAEVLQDVDGDGKMDAIPANWGLGWQLSLGVEYLLTESWAIRAGYGTVASPVPADTYDPSLPDGRRDQFCLGGGYKGDWWKVDLGYMFVMWQGDKDNEVGTWDNPATEDPFARGSPNGKANGHYTTVVHLLALTMSAWF